MKLIDLDELLKYPIRLDHYDKENGNVHFVYGVESVIEYAECLPIVDAEPVVKCEHCIYNTRNTDGVPEDWCYKHGIDIDIDDYCSCGETI